MGKRKVQLSKSGKDKQPTQNVTKGNPRKKLRSQLDNGDKEVASKEPKSKSGEPAVSASATTLHKRRSSRGKTAENDSNTHPPAQPDLSEVFPLSQTAKFIPTFGKKKKKVVAATKQEDTKAIISEEQIDDSMQKFEAELCDVDLEKVVPSQKYEASSDIIDKSSVDFAGKDKVIIEDPSKKIIDDVCEITEGNIGSVKSADDDGSEKSGIQKTLNMESNLVENVKYETGIEKTNITNMKDKESQQELDVANCKISDVSPATEQNTSTHCVGTNSQDLTRDETKAAAATDLEAKKSKSLDLARKILEEVSVAEALDDDKDEDKRASENLNLPKPNETDDEIRELFGPVMPAKESSDIDNINTSDLDPTREAAEMSNRKDTKKKKVPTATLR